MPVKETLTPWVSAQSRRFGGEKINSLTGDTTRKGKGTEEEEDRPMNGTDVWPCGGIGLHHDASFESV